MPKKRRSYEVSMSFAGSNRHELSSESIRYYIHGNDGELYNQIIEVGEHMKVVCKRFQYSGLTVEKKAKRMDAPVTYARKTC